MARMVVTPASSRARKHLGAIRIEALAIEMGVGVDVH